MSELTHLSAEWVAAEVLNHARRVFHARRFVRVQPLIRFRCMDLGPAVFVELLPSLALAVRDYDTGELLALSHPFDFEALDMEGLTNEAALTALVNARSCAMAHQSGKPDAPAD